MMGTWAFYLRKETKKHTLGEWEHCGSLDSIEIHCPILMSLGDPVWNGDLMLCPAGPALNTHISYRKKWGGLPAYWVWISLSICIELEAGKTDTENGGIFPSAPARGRGCQLASWVGVYCMGWLYQNFARKLNSMLYPPDPLYMPYFSFVSS